MQNIKAAHSFRISMSAGASGLACLIPSASSLIALHTRFKFIQYPQHMYIWYEETNTIHTIYVNQVVC